MAGQRWLATLLGRCVSFVFLLFFAMTRFFLAAALVVVTFLGMAQTPGNGGPTPQPAATTVPLDGGAGLLLAGGIGLALRKLRQRRR